jgi:signal transduction histidine kinase/HAMP domain-containing protein
MKAIERFAKRLDPRRSVAARLLVAFGLLWLVPSAVFVFVLERRLTDLQETSSQRLEAVKVAEAAIRIGQDASYRAEWVGRRVKMAEESAWVLADEARVLLEETGKPERGLPSPDDHGHIWNREDESGSVGYLMASRAHDPGARRDAARLADLAPAMRALRERRPSVKAVSIWTASGVMRRSPWLDIHEAIKDSGGALASWTFNRLARFPEMPPATGDRPVWISSFVRPRLTSDVRSVGLLVPVRNSAGRLVAGLSLEMDARRFFVEAIEAVDVQGDLWFALDSNGHAILMTSRAAALLKWRGDPNETLSESSDPGRQALASAILQARRPASEYVFDGKSCRFVSARVPETNWAFVEGLSSEALHRLEDEAEQEVQPERYRRLKRDVLLLFAYLFAVVLLVTWQLSRRISAPVERLVKAAEDIGEGRSTDLVAGTSRDELGRLASALESMSKRVERRVETLRRLHTLLRLTYRTTDMREVLARCAEGVAAFTRAERVIFFLHNPDTNRLEAAWPGWNLTEDVAGRLRIPVDGRSIAGMVFRTGEVYATNDLEHDPYAARALQQITGPMSSSVFAPLKTEDKTIGVAAAFNRPGGFGHEEVDAVTSFADAASLLITNARLYETLTGTVEELRRASRLKDQFLQNVNHELRTPLTSIVGWTDLLEEQQLDAQTLRRGQRQVRQSARVLLALIDDLLDLARMDRGTLVLERKSVALGDLAQRSLETVRMMAEAQGVTLILAPLPEEMPLLRADPLRLQQVFWNLLTNAIKFTRRHGRVVVRIETEPERYLVSVEDDGIGIPESELPHVFERFRQVDGSPTRRHSGMGIGLSLVRSLVELHGGTIWAESVVGHGSRFTFTLPITHVERRAAASGEDD